MAIPRPEYPRPQFERVDWLCLNGAWQFERDPGDSGLERGLRERALTERIVVPFCPESPLSGIGDPDFLHAVWYRREVEIPSEWAGKVVLLHFQAIDYDATVWVNDQEVGRHRGGFTPVTCNLRGIAKAGEKITIVVRARDDNRVSQPRGKQATKYAPHACFYTRTTGIWQTVWLEPVPDIALQRPRITPDVANRLIRLEQPLTAHGPGPHRAGLRVRASLADASGVFATADCAADLDLCPRLDLAIPEGRCRLWSPGDPHLYDLQIELLDSAGQVIDRAVSYAGLRGIALDGRRVKLNGRPLFQRLVLDQGYYPEGVMTAPTDAALIQDIEISQAAGFNGARLHQKVFEERFLYHADRMGYLLWGEFADWGCSGMGPFHDHQQPGITYATQWLEVLERDYSHPSIIGWCGLNETHQALHDKITTLDDATRAMFLAAKAMDPTRPILDTSGYAHRVIESDIYDAHDYIEDKNFADGLEKFRKRHAGLARGEAFANPHKSNLLTPEMVVRQRWSIPYRGQPYFISEFGGFKWNPETVAKSAEENLKERKTSWGYGSDPVSLEDFYARFEAVCAILLDNPDMFGYCYTQLTDIYPEENGLYAFDRTPKFDNERLHRIQHKLAAVESPSRDDDSG